MKRNLILAFALLFFVNFAQAQNREVEEDYISEFIYGVNLNTNGGLIGGIMFKSNKIVKPKVYRSLGLEIVQVKNRKELRNQSTVTGNSFIPGKRNYLYSFRFQYGRDYILFRKAPEEGVQVSATFAAGPSVGVLVPYFILYQFQDGIRSEQYDPDVHVAFDRILGTGGFLEGIANSDIILGAHIKAGLSLDFGAFRNSITGIEAGFTFEFFNNRPEILVAPPDIRGGIPPDTQIPNRQVFGAAFINIFFGTRK